MIANTTNGRQVTSTMTGDEIAMTIDAEDFGKIIGIVTDLYSDRPMAVLREYSTNAHDAHLMAGVTRPIEVTLPDRWSPFLKIKDYGVGLNHDEIREVYAKYGKSTKSASNDFNGMLGLGCKSGLTYADMFTVTSVKDGVRIQVSVSRSTGAPSMTVVDTAQTDEPNGVEVTIPANQHDGFERKARHLFQFWPEGSVLVNGKAPERFVDGDHRKLSDDIYVTDKVDQDYVVMGNVPYPTEIAHGLGWRTHMVAFVPIGSVDFAPSREALMDTPVTKATLARIVDDFKAKATSAAQAAVANAATPREAIHEAKGWRDILGREAVDLSKLTYQGRQFPTAMSYPKNADGSQRRGFRLVPMRSTRYNAKSDAYYIEPEQLSSLVWVTNYSVENFSAPTKKKLVKWAADNNINVDYFVLTDQTAPTFWIGQDRVVDYLTIKQIKLPLTQAQIDARANGRRTASGRIPGSYDMFVHDGTTGPDYTEGKPANDIDQRKPIYWCKGSWSIAREYADALTRLHPKGYTVVILQENRIPKFCRNFPQARPVRDGIGKAHKLFMQSINVKTQRMLYVQDKLYVPAWLAKRVKDIKDPAIRSVVQDSMADLSTFKSERQLYSRLGFPTSFDSKVVVRNPLAKYPLVNSRYDGGGGDDAHALFYINALYEAREAGASAL